MQKLFYECPVCGTVMNNPVGNVHTCEECDFTATAHQLERIIANTKPPPR